MSADGQRTKRRRNIAENFYRLSRAHERYRQTDGRATTYSEREREFTFANCNCQVLVDKGAKLTADEDGWTPLHIAASSVNPDRTVIPLLVAAVDPNLSGDSSPLEAKTSVGQNTALHLAARNTKAPAPLRYGIHAGYTPAPGFNMC